MTPRIGRIRFNNALETLSTISIQSKSNELLVFGIYAQGFCFFFFYIYENLCKKSKANIDCIDVIFVSALSLLIWSSAVYFDIH